MFEHLGFLDWTIFLGYLAVVFGLGLAFAGGQQTNEDYFVGGRKMRWWPVGISLFATAFSSVSFVALPREGAYEDYHVFLTMLLIPLVITPLLWWVFVPVYVRLRLTSVYEYLEIRFHPLLRRFGTILFAGYAVGWMGSMLYTVGLIILSVVQCPATYLPWILIGVGAFAMVYTVLGGVKAVIWTDVLQAITLGGGMLIVLCMALGQIPGGFAEVVRVGAANDKFEMFNFTSDLTLRRSFWTACAFGLFVYLPGYTISQVTVQRYVCMADLKEARRALAINAVVVTVVAAIFFFAGTTLYAFYHQAGASGFPNLASQDQLLPHFVTTELARVGLTGLLTAALFAAAMSTIDSGVNSLTAVVVCDWLGGRTPSVTLSRILTLILGVVVIAAAILASYAKNNVIDLVSEIAGTFLGLLLGLFFLGILVPRANALGATMGLLAGTTSLVCVRVFFPDVPQWWYGAISSIPTFAVGWAASFAASAPSKDQRRGLLWCLPEPGDAPCTRNRSLDHA